MALLIIELAILVLFCVVALVKVYAGNIPGIVTPSLSWLTPTNFGGVSALSDGLLVAVFLYWGWDTATSVNEECTDSNTTPGLAGVHLHVHPGGDLRVGRVRGAGGAGRRTTSPTTPTTCCRRPVTSCSARRASATSRSSCSSSRCSARRPPAARRRSCPRPAPSLSMAMHRAFPPKLGEVDPRHLTPAFATWLFGILSSLWFAGAGDREPPQRRRRARVVGRRRRA